MSGMGLKRFLLYSFINIFKRIKIYKSCKNKLIVGNLDTYGVYFYNSKYFSDKLNELLKRKAYYSVFKKIYSKSYPDAIYAVGSAFVGNVASYIKEKHKTPYVLNENTGFAISKSSSNYDIQRHIKGIENSDRLFFVSNFQKQITLMNEIAYDSKKTFVIGNPVNENLFYIKNRKTSDNFRIFTTGYNSYIKDYDTFFKSIKSVVEQGHKDILVTIGITYDLQVEALKNKAIFYNVFDYCEFLTEIDREEMVNYYNNSDVYIQTSIIETFGISMLESLFCGVPIISTSNGGVDEFISQENGIKVKIGDYEGIANAIIKIKNKEIVFLPEKIRESAILHHENKVFKEKLANIFVELIKNK
jgi:glycosyltransferase involved in cell wall biosynthesis